jgi:hypothetical protein
MSGLWTNDRDTLALFLSVHTLMDFGAAKRLLEQATADGVVRVLDPDDTELVNRIARVICYGTEPPGIAATAPEPWRRTARAVIEALRQP